VKVLTWAKEIKKGGKKYCWVSVYGIKFYFFLMKLVGSEEGGKGVNFTSKLLITREWRTAGNCVFFFSLSWIGSAVCVCVSLRRLIYFLSAYRVNTHWVLNKIFFGPFHT
jgi:hypothetical protein